MNRYLFALLFTTALAACGDLGVSSVFGALGLTPVLDSIFVGDRLIARQVHYVDPNGNPAPAGPVAWGSSDTTVAKIDTVSGAITGRKRGVAVISARAQGLQALALVVVSDTLDITLLIDTVYMMPNDTLTLPIVVRKANPPAAAVWFTAPPNNSFTVDSATGLVTATATTGGPFRYIVHADSLADTGTVTVMTLNDTAVTGGKVFFSVRGTANTHVSGQGQATNYRARTKQAFLLTGKRIVNGNTLQTVKVISPDSITLAGAYAIDSLSPTEDSATVSSPPAICAAPRTWAVWSVKNGIIVAYSRRGGTLGVTQIMNIPNGQAISGRFTFIAQRTDLYTDPLGALAITGSFVVPLVTSATVCR